jgi:hypothetical protein
VIGSPWPRHGMARQVAKPVITGVRRLGLLPMPGGGLVAVDNTPGHDVVLLGELVVAVHPYIGPAYESAFKGIDVSGRHCTTGLWPQVLDTLFEWHRLRNAVFIHGGVDPSTFVTTPSPEWDAYLRTQAI